MERSVVNDFDSVRYCKCLHENSLEGNEISDLRNIHGMEQLGPDFSEGKSFAPVNEGNIKQFLTPDTHALIIVEALSKGNRRTGAMFCGFKGPRRFSVRLSIRAKASSIRNRFIRFSRKKVSRYSVSFPNLDPKHDPIVDDYPERPKFPSNEGSINAQKDPRVNKQRIKYLLLLETLKHLQVLLIESLNIRFNDTNCFPINLEIHFAKLTTMVRFLHRTIRAFYVSINHNPVIRPLHNGPLRDILSNMPLYVSGPQVWVGNLRVWTDVKTRIEMEWRQWLQVSATRWFEGWLHALQCLSTVLQMSEKRFGRHCPCMVKAAWDHGRLARINDIMHMEVNEVRRRFWCGVGVGNEVLWESGWDINGQF
jgi:hypothetical protein